MDKVEQINYYAVKQDLFVAKCDNFEDCIKQYNFLYAIEETRGGWHNPVTTFNNVIFYNPYLEIKLIGKDKASFALIENNWKVINIKIGFPKKDGDIPGHCLLWILLIL